LESVRLTGGSGGLLAGQDIFRFGGPALRGNSQDGIKLLVEFYASDPTGKF